MQRETTETAPAGRRALALFGWFLVGCFSRRLRSRFWRRHGGLYLWGVQQALEDREV